MESGKSVSEGNSKGFVFPSIYYFPPFFTKQPNQRAFESQIRNWGQLIVEYCKYHKIWAINKNGSIVSKGIIGSNEVVSDDRPSAGDNISNNNNEDNNTNNGDDDDGEGHHSPDDGNVSERLELFNNTKINRHLKIEFIEEIFKYMVTNNMSGWHNQDILNNYQRKSDSRDSIIVYWKTPDDWAAMILEFIESTGNSGSIMTLYELTLGEMVRGQEFYGLHPFLLHQSLQVLVNQNRAQLMKDENGVVAGMKII
ncbi:ESCRT-II subunit protein [Saccharomycopsis crataegensis]|uniref:ESCRT-II subunit protein n=1 Tax=Saccharomycopsis crataegensis TaxID=43959 RepID=A0AAV5QJW3_9ASCO|nr:ESCRT-II subunit protein [Saccharomycopsis crataegensis]